MSDPTATAHSSDRLIVFDIGLHHGDDTDFYLKKGYDVVAIEADPRHVEKARVRFKDALESGRLEIVDKAIAPEPGIVTFYQNLDKDDWGSIDPAFGTRDDTRYNELTVPAVTFDEIYARVTTGRGARRVHYIKCDIEGGDIYVLQQLGRCANKPRYISVESVKLEYLAWMLTIGCTAFKLANQNLNWLTRLPKPAREGLDIEYAFVPGSSGPFGEELPGRWLSFREAAELYLTLRRAGDMYPSISNAWYDFHGRFDRPGDSPVGPE